MLVICDVSKLVAYSQSGAPLRLHELIIIALCKLFTSKIVLVSINTTSFSTLSGF
jgi:hypothetical protein